MLLWWSANKQHPLQNHCLQSVKTFIHINEGITNSLSHTYIQGASFSSFLPNPLVSINVLFHFTIFMFLSILILICNNFNQITGVGFGLHKAKVWVYSFWTILDVLANVVFFSFYFFSFFYFLKEICIIFHWTNLKMDFLENFLLKMFGIFWDLLVIQRY